MKDILSTKLLSAPLHVIASNDEGASSCILVSVVFHTILGNMHQMCQYYLCLPGNMIHLS